MSETKQSDGGPAFPVPQKWQNDRQPLQDEWNTFDGMSLRDYYFGQVMLGLITHGEHQNRCMFVGFEPNTGKEYPKRCMTESELCGYALAIADAMLAALKAPNGGRDNE